MSDHSPRQLACNWPLAEHPLWGQHTGLQHFQQEVGCILVYKARETSDYMHKHCCLLPPNMYGILDKPLNITATIKIIDLYSV